MPVSAEEAARIVQGFGNAAKVKRQSESKLFKAADIVSRPNSMMMGFVANWLSGQVPCQGAAEGILKGKFSGDDEVAAITGGDP